MKQLNPAIRKNTTPPDYPDFALHIPQGTRERFITAAAGLPAAAQTAAVIDGNQSAAPRLQEVAYTQRRNGPAVHGVSREARRHALEHRPDPSYQAGAD